MKWSNHTVNRKSASSTALAVASGFSFYILCMILPLVGPSGSRVEHAGQNKATFLIVLLVTLGLSIASMCVSLQRRREEGGAFPRFASGLCILCIGILVVLLFNGFAI